MTEFKKTGYFCSMHVLCNANLSLPLRFQGFFMLIIFIHSVKKLITRVQRSHICAWSNKDFYVVLLPKKPTWKWKEKNIA